MLEALSLYETPPSSPSVPRGEVVFVTWHLYGCLPPASFPAPHNFSAGQGFAWMDRYLDRRTSGSMYLKQEPIARMIIECLHHGVRMGHYKLAAYVVMGNHVHALIYPLIDYSKAMKSLKGFTARQANRMLGLTGQPFWQAESYDRWVRNEEEFAGIVAYIENNPVTAGLVERPEDYPYSSAFENYSVSA